MKVSLLDLLDVVSFQGDKHVQLSLFTTDLQVNIDNRKKEKKTNKKTSWNIQKIYFKNDSSKSSQFGVDIWLIEKLDV